MSSFGSIAAVFLALGLLLTAALFVYELGVNHSTRSLLKELSLVIPASILLGFGILFLFLWFGIYL